MVEALRGVALARNVTVAQIAIASVAAQGHDIVPLVGARTRLTQAFGAVDLVLTSTDLTAVEAAMPASAVPRTRYASDMMANLDSEH